MPTAKTLSSTGIPSLLISALAITACQDNGRNPLPPDDEVDERIEVTVCKEPLLPQKSGEPCLVIPGTGPTFLLRGDVLGHETVFQHGEVLLIDDKIACVGCNCGLVLGAVGATRIECANSVISPGLINTHDHLDFSENWPVDHGAERYNHRHDWLETLSKPRNPHGTEPDSAGMQWGELRMLFSGVTSIVGAGWAAGLLRNLDALEPEETQRALREVVLSNFPLGDSNAQFRNNCDWKYTLRESQVARLPTFIPHIAEGINDYAATEFFCQSRSSDGGQDFTEGNTSHIHGMGLLAEDYFRMAHDRANLIWSPRSNISLYGMTAGVTLFANLGGIIALGTDWTLTGSANMLRELACANSLNLNYYDNYFSAKDLHDMVTANAARATSNYGFLGSLEKNKLADLVIFQGQPKHFYRAVFEGNSQTLLLSLKNGRPLFGQPSLVQAFDESCEPINICGKERQICAKREFGQTYEQIAERVLGDGNRAYPAIFCDEIPPSEPSCVPARPDEFTGALVDNDLDGDGIANEQDNCAELFNPPRPLDEGVQKDTDEDGLGDACDPEPIVLDIDDDGVNNEDDNCPFAPNANQKDGDTDERGDICDECPIQPNISRACIPLPPNPGEVTIDDIQRGKINPGKRVTLYRMIVTCARGGVIHIQDPSAPSGKFSAIRIILRSVISLSYGDIIYASGIVSESEGSFQLLRSSTRFLGSTPRLLPIDVTIAQALTPEFRNVLVRIRQGTLIDPYDCTQDDPACTDSGLFGYQSGGATLALDPSLFYRGANFRTHIGKLPVVGCTGPRFGALRLYPRSQDDFGP